MDIVTINNRECYKVELPFSKGVAYVKARTKGKEAVAIDEATLDGEPRIYRARFVIEQVIIGDYTGELTKEMIDEMDMEDLDAIGNAMTNARASLTNENKKK